jgi:hypothetical protein
MLIHALALVKSYYPGAVLSRLPDGAEGNCTEEKFDEYRNM